MTGNSVSLVCMPWHTLGSPSIQLGTVHASLARAGITCASHSLHVEFMRFLSGGDSKCARLDLEEYAAIGSEWMNVGAGEWKVPL